MVPCISFSSSRPPMLPNQRPWTNTGHLPVAQAHQVPLLQATGRYMQISLMRLNSRRSKPGPPLQVTINLTIMHVMQHHPTWGGGGSTKTSLQVGIATKNHRKKWEKWDMNLEMFEGQMFVRQVAALNGLLSSPSLRSWLTFQLSSSSKSGTSLDTVSFKYIIIYIYYIIPNFKEQKKTKVGIESVNRDVAQSFPGMSSIEPHIRNCCSSKQGALIRNCEVSETNQPPPANGLSRKHSLSWVASSKLYLHATSMRWRRSAAWKSLTTNTSLEWPKNIGREKILRYLPAASSATLTLPSCVASGVTMGSVGASSRRTQAMCSNVGDVKSWKMQSKIGHSGE